MIIRDMPLPRIESPMAAEIVVEAAAASRPCPGVARVLVHAGKLSAKTAEELTKTRARAQDQLRGSPLIGAGR